MAINSQIGSFDFISMTPPPPYPYQGTELDARAGVDGYAAWKIGVTADEFAVSTLRDVATLAHAESLLLAYQASVTSLGTIHYAGIIRPYLVLVRKVEPEEIRSTLIGVGGINGISRAILRAKWTLLPWFV